LATGLGGGNTIMHHVAVPSSGRDGRAEEAANEKRRLAREALAREVASQPGSLSSRRMHRKSGWLWFLRQSQNDFHRIAENDGFVSRRSSEKESRNGKTCRFLCGQLLRDRGCQLTGCLGGEAIPASSRLAREALARGGCIPTRLPFQSAYLSGIKLALVSPAEPG